MGGLGLGLQLMFGARVHQSAPNGGDSWSEWRSCAMRMDAPDVASGDICTVPDVVGAAALGAGEGGETITVLSAGLASLLGSEASAG